MPIDGLVVYGHYNGSRGSNTPGFSNGLGNGSTPVPGFSNETVHAGTDLDGSGGQEWIQIIILILFVVFLPPILFGSVRWWRRRRFGMRNGNVPAVQFEQVAHNLND